MSKIMKRLMMTMLSVGACATNKADLEIDSAQEADGSGSIDFMARTVKKSIDYGRFRLVSHSHDAMVLIVRCDDPPEDPTRCDRMFDPGQEYVHIPVAPHCGPGSIFDCSNKESSFVAHEKDHYVTGLELRTGSFIEGNQVITAAHTLDRSRLHHTYAIMNLAQSAHAWPSADLDGDRIHDHARIDPQFVLRVARVVACEDTYAGPDWAVLEVQPILPALAKIPDHTTFELATYEPHEGAKISVPSHPRGLPLKLADGVITSAAPRLHGIFDVAGGSSGSPVLDRENRIVGINRSRIERVLGSGELYKELVCESVDPEKYCFEQPLTPATRIGEILSRPYQPGTCSLVP